MTGEAIGKGNSAQAWYSNSYRRLWVASSAELREMALHARCFFAAFRSGPNASCRVRSGWRGIP